MNNYLIKIQCTSHEQLCYNNSKIKKNNIIQLKILELINNYDYITSALIVYKKLNKFSTKTLEFTCNKEINEIEFSNFIQTMLDYGFYSYNNNTIKFFNYNEENRINLILEFNYQLNQKIISKPITKKFKNKSSYSTCVLCKK